MKHRQNSKRTVKEPARRDHDTSGKKKRKFLTIKNISFVVLFLTIVHRLLKEEKELFSVPSSSTGSTGSVDDDATSASATATATATAISERQSYGFVNDVNDEEWESVRKKVHARPVLVLPSSLDEYNGTSSSAAQFNHKYIVPNFDCPNVVEVGGRGGKLKIDGTKYLCNPERLLYGGGDDDKRKKDRCLIYSFGCAGMYAFEDGIAKMHDNRCEIHVFDPAKSTSPKGDRKINKERNIHYHSWGLLSSYDKKQSSNVWPAGYGGTYKTIEETMELLGHNDASTGNDGGSVVDVFKLDCEGCEWDSYKDWMNKGFRQILVENHGVPLFGGDGNKKLDKVQRKWINKDLNASEYYEEFAKNGYALYHADYVGFAVDVSFIKLNDEFWASSA